MNDVSKAVAAKERTSLRQVVQCIYRLFFFTSQRCGDGTHSYKIESGSRFSCDS